VVDIQNIRELLELMVEHGLSEIKVRDGQTTIVLRKGGTGQPVVVTAPHVEAAPGPGQGPESAAAAETERARAEDDGLVPIASPMVGTVYLTPDPESPAFVSVGDEVQPETTVCIIEAMKVFNEIHAEVSGTVERILVHNEQAVEYGQPLMLVRPRS